MTNWTDDERVTIAYKDDWKIQVAIIHEEVAMPSSMVVETFKNEQKALGYIHAAMHEWAKEYKFTGILPEFKSLAFIHTIEFDEHKEYAFSVAVDKKTLDAKRTPDEQGHYWKWGEYYRETWLA